MGDKLEWLNCLLQFLSGRLSSFNSKGFCNTRKDSLTYSLYEGRTSIWTGLFSRKFCRFLTIFSTGFTTISVVVLFIYKSPCLSLCTVFDAISSLRDEVVSINTSANMFFFGDFNVHHKDWVTYFGETDRHGELCYNNSASNDLTQMLNFPTWVPDCDFLKPALLDFLLSSDASICSVIALSPLGNSDLIVVSEFLSNSKEDSLFHWVAHNYSRAN